MKKLIFMLLFALLLYGCAARTPSDNADGTSAAVTSEVLFEAAFTVETVLPEAGTTDTLVSEMLSVPITEAVTDTSVPEIETEPVPETEPEPEPPNGYIYLTFDDGPCRYTEQVLEILNEYGVKATFFLVGTAIEKYPDGARAIHEAEHDIGCHSATHVYGSIYKSADAMTDDIKKWESIMESVIGEVPEERLYRYPGGSNCTAIGKGMFKTLHSSVTALGYRGFDWNCANNDKWQVSKREDQTLDDFLKESVKSTLSLCRGVKIMLLHETAAETVDMLPWLIEYLISEGYGFATLSEFEGEYLFAA